MFSRVITLYVPIASSRAVVFATRSLVYTYILASAREEIPYRDKISSVTLNTGSLYILIITSTRILS
jgi:hypothetical protein